MKLWGVFLATWALSTPASSQPVAETTAEARASILAINGALLQADGPQARQGLASLSPDALSFKDRQWRDCVSTRLAAADDTFDAAVTAPFADKALAAYRAYWLAATNDPSRRTEIEVALIQRLSDLLGADAPEDASAVGRAVITRIQSEGGYALGGRTGRLLELMLWKSQTEKRHQVELPEGPHEVTVFYLDDFVSRGWSGFMTCERSSTGGWAKSEGIYAIVPAYSSLEDENFQINYLAHETQHFADYGVFPDLKPWELEYRAKLTELAMARTTGAGIVSRFARNRSDDPNEPHSYANGQVIKALSERLDLAGDFDPVTLDADLIRQAADAALRADTARRKAADTRPQ
ncbi:MULTISPECIES: hypothetical protein [unclassified Brevundimonas]|uniref:hypothetical protein n=1 Tax=unclassified Brevundimonas TaxID=2622653 RepID=UPI0025C6ACBA|nr:MULTISPECIES: hypothetical protein [unclassified Brevundimonas]